MIKAKAKKQTPQDRKEPSEKCLANNVRSAMEDYFDDLDGHQAGELYELFLQQVEKPFFDVVMQHSKGNLSQAAKILGLNRATLRSRLKKYNLD
ncbi:MAG: helix-turn-helix domain-containing protein [Pseudomonadota bacterium]